MQGIVFVLVLVIAYCRAAVTINERANQIFSFRKEEPATQRDYISNGIFTKLCSTAPLEDIEKYLYNQENMDVDPNWADKNGDLPLIVAVMKKRTEVVDFLLGENAEYFRQNSAGDNALHAAVKANWLEGVKLIFGAPISPKNYANGVDMVDGTGIDTVLHIAVRNKNVEMIKYLLQNGAKVGRDKDNALTLAKTMDLADEQVLNLLKENQRSNTAEEQKSDIVSRFGRICESASLEEVQKFMLEENVDPNWFDETGQSPLLLAISNKRSDVLKFLLDAGADYSLVDIHGNTPLQQTVNIGWKQGVELILAAPTRPTPEILSVKGPNDFSALHYAVFRANLPIVKLLVENGAKLFLHYPNSVVDLADTLMMNDDKYDDISEYLHSHVAVTGKRKRQDS